MMDWGIRRSIMFHVRRRPADSQPRRRKKKPLGASNGANNPSNDREGPVLVEVTHSGDGGRRIKLSNDPVEVGSANTNSLQLFGPSIQPRHCLIALSEGVCTVTPLHADALTFVNGHHITQPTILHNGSVVMFGRVASYRFLDAPSDGRYNLALSQSQLDSACLYESRSPISPASWNDEDGTLSLNQKDEFDITNSHNGILPERIIHLTEDNKKRLPQEHLHAVNKDVETNFDGTEPNLEINLETKSISSLKSNGSITQEQRVQKTTVGLEREGQEPILPAVLEFPETHQEKFLCQIITELDVNSPHFKLAPVYALYLCARYRASTHYRPELQPTERAHKLTIFLHHISKLVYSVIQEQYANPRILAFWMANSSEFLHFLKSDRHISAFSVQAQEILAECVQTSFRNLVNCFRMELSQTLNQFLSETIDHDSASGLVLTVLGSAMALLRRCRVNAALTIQLFSQLFHYINVICFNTIVASSHMCTAEWGKILTDRLQLLELWAERQGLELAADCHLAKINQCAQFLQAPKTSVEEIQKLACSCFRLNSLQMSALLQQETIPRILVDTVIRMAESVADELTRADGREVRLEESPELHLALLLPDDGFSCDVVRGIPSGLIDFLNPLQSAGMCRLAAQPTSIGLWTVYMHQFNVRSPSSMSNKLPQPEIQIIKLHKNSNGMGLSIVAAKGAGQERLGIYIKSVVQGGAADADGRLQAGDQLLRVDGQSLIGITQERAADYLVRTGPVVTLEVAKQGAIYHGLATLLQQPSPIIQRGGKWLSEKEALRLGGELKNVGPPTPSHLANSKSVPALNASSNNVLNSKSRSTHSLVNSSEHVFYQNLSVYRTENQNSHISGDRPPTDSMNSNGNAQNINQQQTSTNNMGGITNGGPLASLNQNNMLSRPTSAYYQNSLSTSFTNASNTSMPLKNSMTLTNDSHGSISCNMSTDGHISALNNQMHHLQSQPPFNNGRSKTMHNFNRDGQIQSSLRINQIFAPSMPNIATSHTTPSSTNMHTTGISSSQSLQNLGDAMPQHCSTNISHTHSQQYVHKSSNNNVRTQQVMGELPIRKNRIEAFQDNPNSTMFGMSSSSNLLILPNQESQLGGVQNTNAVIIPTSKHSHFTSKQKSNRGPQNYQKLNADETPPLPPTTTHPLFKNSNQISQPLNYVASTVDPPKGGFYTVNNSAAHQPNFMSSNPWEREEREKEHEIRREHIRQWRDQQIIELSGIAKRTAPQEEQLKTLVLEREFERRVQEVEDQEDECEPVPEKDISRLNVQQNYIPNPITNVRQTNIRIEHVEKNGEHLLPTNDPQLYNPNYQQPIQFTAPPKGILKNNRYDTTYSVAPSSPSKSQKSASFADERRIQTEHAISNLVKDVSNISLNVEINANNNERSLLAEHSSQLSGMLTNIDIIPPPPPPERNSSYIVMSQQQQKNRNSSCNILKGNISDILPENNVLTYSKKPNISTNATNNNNNPSLKIMPHNLNESHSLTTEGTGNMSTNHLNVGRDIKRVSFHDEENNYLPSQMITHSIDQYHDNDQPDLKTTDENIHDITSEALQNATTHDVDVWNSTTQSTPGVIGAQEVYRDPRQRRLDEQQQKQQQRTTEAVPEKLSFKEKMKMFALESGEDHTPKDKLKISRAQRDIDAVMH